MPADPGPAPIELLPETQRSLLTALKTSASATIGDLATKLGVAYETIRHHIAKLEAMGWVDRQSQHGGGAGRPEGMLKLTDAGEQLFAKAYDQLAVALVDTVAEHFGADAVGEILASIADTKVAAWAPLVEGKPLVERLEILKELYSPKDPFMEVRVTARGPILIEHNCPYHAVAMARPALCSLTVSVLSRLLGARVIRDCAFQRGDGCCSFRILQDEPTEPSFRFALEEPYTPAAH